MPPAERAPWYERAATKDERTDRTRWRLLDERGRQRWKYLKTKKEADEWPQTAADRFHLGLDTQLPDQSPAHTPLEAVHNGLSFFSELQLDPGNWACEYGGPMFLLPGCVITWYVTGTDVPEETKTEIRNYLWARQNKIDGGWGLHIEGDSSVFGTAMNYTTLRLLGAPADDLRLIKARALLHSMGGALMGPHWTKFWLSVLGVYEWEGVNPVPPQLWLLPDWVPIAPWRWWVHMRQVFLPMSFIWSHRYSHPLTPLTRQLRNELYPQAYAAISFAAHRNSISPKDNYHPKTALLNTINWALVNVLPPVMSTIQKRAEDWVYELIQMEDANTDYANLGPVNAPMNMIARMIREGVDSEPVKRHRDRLDDFLWVNKEGMLMNGTNGVQTWDTAFVIQAVVEAGVAQDPKWHPMLLNALKFLDDQQIREECRDQAKCYRHNRKGAWAFSTRDQGYTVSDCTAEGAKSVMLLQALPGFPTLVDRSRLEDAIDVLLTMQNSTGGFASYEQTRGNATLMESLNAAEVFGNIMVEYDYPECSTAVVTGLALFTKTFPDYRAEDIKITMKRAVDWISNAQRPDGAWYGSWGICFTYATMFALESLAAVGDTYASSKRAQAACKFLLEHQNADGGWGESYRSCEIQEWVDHPQGSQVAQTAWACIALMEADFPEKEPIARGLKLIMKRQQANGEWLQEGIEGVFNKTCMISYPNYKFVFPIKALGMFARRHGDAALI
ncbi:hypothetical protein FH972_024574 [Carpinus fangiana]|uniref:Terpene cyclase/mutase family member n=1 Tax=Carpinus fangiana TaxID=176857 RepID=A0A5N6KYT3_9ROSI|nr:hypothetical protein FH972_024574 [Carpinus fangiana]